MGLPFTEGGWNGTGSDGQTAAGTGGRVGWTAPAGRGPGRGPGSLAHPAGRGGLLPERLLPRRPVLGRDQGRKGHLQPAGPGAPAAPRAAAGHGRADHPARHRPRQGARAAGLRDRLRGDRHRHRRGRCGHQAHGHPVQAPRGAPAESLRDLRGRRHGNAGGLDPGRHPGVHRGPARVPARAVLLPPGGRKGGRDHLHAGRRGPEPEAGPRRKKSARPQPDAPGGRQPPPGRVDGGNRPQGRRADAAAGGGTAQAARFHPLPGPVRHQKRERPAAQGADRNQRRPPQYGRTRGARRVARRPRCAGRLHRPAEWRRPPVRLVRPVPRQPGGRRGAPRSAGPPGRGQAGQRLPWS